MLTESAALIAFWSAAALLIYAYAGYPLVVFVWAVMKRRPVREQTSKPPISLLIVAYNEAAAIDAKVRNCLSLDYPPERLNVVIASDGSTDDTAAIARTHAPQGVEVIAFRHRRGKAAVFNDLLPRLPGEIVVLADARQQIETGALRALVEAFADPGVGAVSGELVLDPEQGGSVGRGVGFYWHYEKLIRRSESAVDSTIGATGALYAIRRTLFEPLPEDTLLDDVLIPVRIIRRGYRVVFDGRARAFDRLPRTTPQEFRRKVRTIAGNFQLFARERWLLNPLRNRLWFQAVSHKGLRLLLPALHAGVLGANVALIGAGHVYLWTFEAQALFYLAAVIGYLGRARPRQSRLMSVPCAVCLMNWATIVGFVRFVRGTQSAAWEPSRIADSAADRLTGAATDRYALE